jgi:hypothetical protein
MRDAVTVRKRRQDKGLEHVMDWRRAQTGPLYPTIPGREINDTSMLRKGGPRHQPAERRQVVFREQLSHPPNGRWRRKLPLTQRVNRHRLARRRDKLGPQQAP